MLKIIDKRKEEEEEENERVKTNMTSFNVIIAQAVLPLSTRYIQSVLPFLITYKAYIPVKFSKLDHLRVYNK